MPYIEDLAVTTRLTMSVCCEELKDIYLNGTGLSIKGTSLYAIVYQDVFEVKFCPFCGTGINIDIIPELPTQE